MYNTFNKYFKKTFNSKVHKVVIDAGFSCPNRDGTLSKDGCIFCNEQGSGSGQSAISIKGQVLQGIKQVQKKYKDTKIMVYFQAFSNTYAPADKLEEIYSQAICHKDIVAISIGTRPDCIDNEKLKIINKFTDKYEVWIEYGLQTHKNETLRKINRHHSFENFLLAIARTKKFPKIKICVHVIFGLPGETEEDMLKTIKWLSAIGIDGIKFHPLYITGDTVSRCHGGTMLSFDEYTSLVAKSIKLLPDNVVIQRLTGDCAPEKLIAPEWMLDKNRVINEINKKLTQQH